MSIKLNDIENIDLTSIYCTYVVVQLQSNAVMSVDTLAGSVTERPQGCLHVFFAIWQHQTKICQHDRSKKVIKLC